MPLRRTALLVVLCAAAPALGAQRVPSPEAYLGFRVGADRTLADWSQILGYFGTLAGASPAVKLDTLGATTLGRPFVLVTISSPENIRNLDAIRRTQARLADPRGLSAAEEARLIASQPAVVLIQCNIHSTEVAAAQMAMELAHRLVTVDTLQQLVRDVVVLLLPSANPDGNQMVTEWYRQNVGTRWEGGPMPWLYHHFVGHDNNRDWYMVTQRETRLVTDLLYRSWFPVVIYDVHQMGNGGMRIFVPPLVDPVNPNLDPILVRAIGHIGAEMALALEERGKQGVGSDAVYDLWWHGGARSTPTRHNIVGVLTEAASVRIATPIEQDSSDLRGHARGLPVYERRVNFPNPWPGGPWRLRDIVEYELIASEALVAMLAQQRMQYVRNFVTMGRNAVRRGETDAPYAFLIARTGQHDPGAAQRLLEVLRVGGVELEATPEAYIVPMAQPYRAHAKDLLEVQRFPHLAQWPGGPPERPYDVAGWTLPLQMGVRVTQADAPLPARGTVVPSLTPTLAASCAASSARGRYVALDPRDSDSYRTLFRALRAGARARIASASVRTMTGVNLPAGTFILERRSAVPADSGRRGCPPHPIAELPAGRTIAGAPRVALYKPWTSSMDEGWTRWVLEQFAVPYVSLTDSMARAGRLRDQFDVILVPDMSLREMRDGMTAAQVPPRYAGGLGTEGIRALTSFARAGGTLVLLDGSSAFAAAELGVPVRLITTARGEPAGAASDSARTTPEPPYAPGSVLRVLIDPSHPVARGMPDTAAVYFTNSITFDVSVGAPLRVIARYPARGDDILLSGFLQGAAGMAGRAAAVEAGVGEGRVVMFGFRPQYRGQSYGTFKLLFNALLEGSPPDRR